MVIIENVMLSADSFRKNSIQLTNIESVAFKNIKFTNCLYTVSNLIPEDFTTNNSNHKRKCTTKFDVTNMESQRSHVQILVRRCTLVMNISKCNINNNLNDHSLYVNVEDQDNVRSQTTME